MKSFEEYEKNGSLPEETPLDEGKTYAHSGDASAAFDDIWLALNTIVDLVDNEYFKNWFIEL